MKHVYRRITLLACVLILVPLAGCARPTPEPLPPMEILDRAIDRTAGLRGFECLLVRDGSRAYLDPFKTMALGRIEGAFVAPDKLEATVRVITPGMVTEFHIISLGEDQWYTNLVTGEWEILPPEWGFYPATLFEPETGMVSVLRDDVSNLVLQGVVEMEEMPGREFYYLTADLSGENLYYVSYGMIASQSMQVELWIDPGSFDIHRIKLTEPLPEEEEPRLWTLDFWDFNQVIEIAPPDLQGVP